MPVDVGLQTTAFLGCILSGLIMGGIYTLIAAIRKVFTFKKTATFIADQIFWIIGIIVLFCTLHITCGGEINWYELAGAFLGLSLYFFGMSKFIYPVMLNLVKFIKRFFVVFLKTIIWPFLKILKIIIPILRPIKKLAQNTRKKVINFGKNNVEKIRRLSILLKRV